MGHSTLRFAGNMACFFLVALCLFLGGCSSLTVLETWHTQSGPERHYRKLMILGIGQDENRRRLFEDIVVDEMGRLGVMAVASHPYVKNLEKAKRDDIVAAVRSAGADGVLTARPLSVGDTTVTQKGSPGGVYGTAAGGFSVLKPASGYVLATIQTNLYDAASAELVWTATVKTFDAAREARVSRELARFFVERLRRDRLL